jgi:hypothetical protein
VGTGREPAAGDGHFVGAALMIAAGIAEVFAGVAAAARSLEDVAEPLSAEAVS